MHCVRPSRHFLVVASLLAAMACGGGGGSPTAVEGRPESIEKVGGDPPATPAGTMAPVAVIVRDGSGAPLANASVRFRVDSGGGWMTDTTVITGADGRAATTWYLGSFADTTNLLRATSGSQITIFRAVAARLPVHQTYFGGNNFVEFQTGDLPIIISAPHGGTLKPTEIPDRTQPATIVRDTNTEELAREISDAFFERYGRRPHVVWCLLHREKIDCNRAILEAAKGNRLAQRSWFEFHGFITAARRELFDRYGKGLYIDLHGHGHQEQRLELGYLTTAADLDQSDLLLSQSFYVSRSSIRVLAESAQATYAELLRGQTSLGAMFESRGFPSVPSPSKPGPAGAEYFNGGYNTDRHGSRPIANRIDGLQIEANFTGVRDTQASRRAFAQALVLALEEYFATHYGMALGS